MTTKTVAGSSRGPYAKSVETRRSIVEACVNVFGETGFHGAAMADIARRAGISTAGLLHHFPNKELLLTEVLRAHDERTAAFLQEHASSEPLSVEEMIRGLVWTLLQQPQQPGLAELGAALSAEATLSTHPAHDYFVARYSGMRHFLARQFAALRSRGAVTSNRSDEALAAMTIALVEGLQKQALYDPAVEIGSNVTDFLIGLATDR